MSDHYPLIERRVAQVISVLFHPLFMATLGILVMFNSGTELSTIQPEVKRIVLIITVIFTFVFPIALVILLYLTRMISDFELSKREERPLPMAVILFMFLFTYFLMRRIPQLDGAHLTYLLAPAVTLLAALGINRYIKASVHMMGLGAITGMVLLLLLIYHAPIQGVFIITVLASGLTATARMVMKLHTPVELLAGYATGLICTFAVMLIGM